LSTVITKTGNICRKKQSENLAGGRIPPAITCHWRKWVITVRVPPADVLPGMTPVLRLSLEFATLRNYSYEVKEGQHQFRSSG
jgi:hypothetical protein